MHTSACMWEDLRHDRARKRLAARIGGISLGLTCDPDGPCLMADAELEDFLVDTERCDLELTVGFSDHFGTPDGELIFDSGGLWKLYRDAGGFCFRFATAHLGAMPYKQALVSQDFSSGRIELARRYFLASEPVNPLEYPLDELLWIHRLAMGEGVEVHGCGVIAPDGRGILLIGHSGAGKSTSARLWSKLGAARVLSDDRIILRQENGRIQMYGTPWHGDAGIAEAAQSPVDAIFVLRHGEANELRQLGEAESTAELFARSFVPHHSPTGLSAVLKFFHAVTSSVPCFGFSFVPDFTAVEAVCRARA
ncbi:MAG: hypothetical protein WAK78_08505 [Candidatus Acidiferrales bacterium]